MIILLLFLYSRGVIPGFGPPHAYRPPGEPSQLPLQPQTPQLTIANASPSESEQPIVTNMVEMEETITPAVVTSQPPILTTALRLILTETQASSIEILTRMTITVTPAPAGHSEYVLAFVPVHWKGSRQEFIDAASRQGDFFIQASGLNNYFNVKYYYFEQVFTDGELTDSDLLDRLLVWAIQREPADRYIGLTDGDLAPDKNTWVAGYTFGIDTQGVMAEITEDTIATHELGHTYGLCDEYNYNAWNEQNLSLPGGCPNPYPPHCPKNTGVVNECDGIPSTDGKMSLMASAGPPELSSYNETCQVHLAKVFQDLAQKAR